MKRPSIPDPENYFQGLDLPGRIISQGVLLFERLSKKALQRKHLVNNRYRADRMHHRYVLTRVLKVPGVVSVDGRSLEVSVGDLLLITPQQFHHYLSVEKEAIHWQFITFELVQGAELLEALQYRVIRSDSRILEYWDELVSLWGSEHSTERMETLPLLDRLLFRLVHLAELAGERDPVGSELSKNEWIVQIEGLVVRSIKEGWSLEEVAKQANLSDRHLRTRFEAAMGISLRDYRANYQLHRALALMRQAELRLSDIAELSGFNSQPSFTRFIKRMTGYAPSEIRASLKLTGGRYEDPRPDHPWPVG